MKNKFSGRGFSYLHTRQIQNKMLDNMLEVAWPDPQLERSNGELENILRWEDDGGAIFEICRSTL